MGVLIQLGMVAGLLLLGFVAGRIAEKRHYARIIKAEKSLLSLPATATRLPPQDQSHQQVLVSGNIVVANDYFKFFTASLKTLFGGRLNSYESLLDRGRREALVRMKQKAKAMDATLVFNVKYVTTNLSAGEQNRMGTLEVLAYGTALIPE